MSMKIQIKIKKVTSFYNKTNFLTKNRLKMLRFKTKRMQRNCFNNLVIGLNLSTLSVMLSLLISKSVTDAENNRR